MSVLYVVATPIGNLSDISQRASDTLRMVDLIAAEDTRRTSILLKHLGIEKKEIISFHKFNETEKTPHLLARLRGGETVAVVSDAGTPLISDPGFSIVREAWLQQIKISPIPGPSSVIAALSICPLNIDRWNLFGFLPSKIAEAESLLDMYLQRPDAIVFFDSPHRILSTLEILEKLSCRQLMVVRELTKVFESMYVGKVSDVRSQIECNLKGEFIVILESNDNVMPNIEEEKLLRVLLDYHELSTASKIVAKVLGLNKRDVYSRGVKLKR